MDNLKIITIIGSILAFIITYLDKREEKLNDLKHQYFDKVLCVYYNKYRKNSKVSSMEFINGYFKNNEVFIPKYVFYLSNDKYEHKSNKDKSNEKRLQEILLVDYYKYYPNKTNIFYGGIDGIFDKGYVLEVFLGVFMICMGSMLILLFFVQLILSIITILQGNLPITCLVEELSANDAWTGLIYGILTLALEAMYYIVASKEFHKNDEYSLKINRIKGIIKRKEKLYNKINTKYYV